MVHVYMIVRMSAGLNAGLFVGMCRAGLFDRRGICQGQKCMVDECAAHEVTLQVSISYVYLVQRLEVVHV